LLRTTRFLFEAFDPFVTYCISITPPLDVLLVAVSPTPEEVLLVIIRDPETFIVSAPMYRLDESKEKS
jgi:hypothetical protein